MDLARSTFHEFLVRTPYIDREEELYSVYTKRVDVLATYQACKEEFVELISYMNKYVQPYAYVLDDTQKHWVPFDYILHLGGNNPVLKKRLTRFVQDLPSCDFVDMDVDVLVSKGFPNTGTKFLSWEMTFIFYLQQGDDSESSTSRASTSQSAEKLDRIEDVPMQEMDLKEEVLLALDAIQALQSQGSSSSPIKEEDIEDDPQYQVWGLPSIIVDGREYLFLHDIEHLFGLREDEALGVLYSFEVSAELDYDTEDVGFLCASGEKSLGENLAHTLVLAKNNEKQIDFPTPFPYHTSSSSQTVEETKSITIASGEVVERDDADQDALEVDDFAMRRGGTRVSFGADSSIGHYIGLIPIGVVLVFHAKMSPSGRSELLKLKALSRMLSDPPISRNQQKVLLVLRKAAIAAFGANLSGKHAVAVGMSLAANEETPQELQDRFVSKTLQGPKKPNILDLLEVAEKLPQ